MTIKLKLKKEKEFRYIDDVDAFYYNPKLKCFSYSIRDEVTVPHTVWMKDIENIYIDEREMVHSQEPIKF